MAFLIFLDIRYFNSYSYLIYKIRYGKKANHKNFRISIILELIKEALLKDQLTKEIRSQTKGKKAQKFTEKTHYITKNFELLPDRFAETKHLPIYNQNNLSCEYCKIINKLENNIAKKNSAKTHFSCEFCKVRLYINNTRNCYYLFHTKTDEELNSMRK